MKALVLFPTWLLVRAVGPFCKPGNCFRDRPPTLAQWRDEATETAQVLSIMLWSTSCGLSILLFNAIYPF